MGAAMSADLAVEEADVDARQEDGDGQHDDRLRRREADVELAVADRSISTAMNSVADPGPPRVIVKGMSKSFSVSAVRRISTATRLGTRKGSCTCRSTVQLDLVSSLAASSISGGTVERPASRTSATKGVHCQMSQMTTAMNAFVGSPMKLIESTPIQPSI